VEIEVRKTLVPSLTLLLNASLIKSEVELGDQFAGQDKNRPMMGQSPYLVNAGLYYNNQEKNLQVNVLYNVIGKRIFIVGDQLSGTIYEMPRNVLDLNFSKGITRNIEIKGGIQDLLNQSFRLIQDNNRDNNINDDDQSYQTFKRGSYFTLGVNFKL
jgi:outer membrane receptor protein involved in Fe transport